MSAKNTFLILLVTLLLNNIIPRAPPKESKKPMSYKENGLHNNISKQEKDSDDNVSVLFRNKSDNRINIAIIPALNTDADEPETRIKITIIIIEKIVDAFFPKILSKINLVASTT